MTLLYAPSWQGGTDFKVSTRRLEIEDFNALADVEACAALTRCCASTRWIQAMMSQRPFKSFAEIFARADEIWWSLDADDWLEAFNHHPRVGSLAALRLHLTNQLGESPPEELLDVLFQTHSAYERRFGYAFISEHSNGDPQELLPLMQTRLRHEPQTELKITAEQQRRLTSHRLSNWLTS